MSSPAARAKRTPAAASAALRQRTISAGVPSTSAESSVTVMAALPVRCLRAWRDSGRVYAAGVLEGCRNQLVRAAPGLVTVRDRHDHQLVGLVLGRDLFEPGT